VRSGALGAARPRRRRARLLAAPAAPGPGGLLPRADGRPPADRQPDPLRRAEGDRSDDRPRPVGEHARRGPRAEPPRPRAAGSAVAHRPPARGPGRAGGVRRRGVRAVPAHAGLCGRAHVPPPDGHGSDPGPGNGRGRGDPRGGGGLRTGGTAVQVPRPDHGRRGPRGGHRRGRAGGEGAGDPDLRRRHRHDPGRADPGARPVRTRHRLQARRRGGGRHDEARPGDAAADLRRDRRALLRRHRGRAGARPPLRGDRRDGAEDPEGRDRHALRGPVRLLRGGRLPAAGDRVPARRPAARVGAPAPRTVRPPGPRRGGRTRGALAARAALAGRRAVDARRGAGGDGARRRPGDARIRSRQIRGGARRLRALVPRAPRRSARRVQPRDGAAQDGGAGPGGRGAAAGHADERSEAARGGVLQPRQHAGACQGSPRGGRGL